MGQGRGIMGKRRGRVFKEQLKGPMDKAKGGRIEGGWGGGCWWEESGDNCAWTTIKIKAMTI